MQELIVAFGPFFGFSCVVILAVILKSHEKDNPFTN